MKIDNKLSSKQPIIKRTWTEFRDSGMLWWCNRILHIFGWAIVFNVDDVTGEILSVEPNRTVWRGFTPELEANGFERVTAWMASNVEDLQREVSEE